MSHSNLTADWLAYLHIVPGALYLLLAPLQLAYRIRSRHYTFHRRLGRVLATAGMISGVFALIFGGLFSFGGLPEAAAAVVFGLWFLTCLVLAVRAIRRDDIVPHRRWMIRAFAIGIGLGTTRIWLQLLPLAGLDFASSFGPAFWISFSLHALIAELWLRVFPNPPELVHESLIQRWPLLRRWLEETQEDAGFLEQLRNAARQWQAKGYPQGLLWRGDAMEEARHWHSRYRGELPDLQRAVLSAVFSLAAKGTRRRRIAVFGAIGLLSALVVAAAIRETPRQKIGDPHVAD